MKGPFVAWGNAFIAAGLLLTAAVSTGMIAGYYPPGIGGAAVLSLFVFLMLSLLYPQTGIFLLFASGPFFGNHPGGRFMELFPILTLIWTGAALLNTSWIKEPHRRREEVPEQGDGMWMSMGEGTGLFLLAAGLFLAIVFIAILAEPWTLLDAIHRERDPFHLLMADEHSPLYTIQQTLWTSLLPLFVFIVGRSRRNNVSGSNRNAGLRSFADWGIAGIAVGFALTMLAGTGEMILPAVARGLDAFHLRIDGYVDRVPPHLFGSIETQSPNSLFWNRSWHGIYLISAMPFFAMFANRRFGQHRPFKAAAVLLAFFFLLYFALLGARGAFLALLTFLGILLPALLFASTEKRPAAKWLMGWLMVVSIGALLLHTILPGGMVLANVGLQEARFAQYAEGVRLFLQFPWTGGGLESYGFYNANILRPLSLAAPHGTSHSQWLQILSGTGVAGGLAYLFLVYLALRGLYLSLRESRFYHEDMPAGREKISSLEPVIFLAGLSSLLVYSTFQEWWYLKPVQAAWWLLIYLCIRSTPDDARLLPERLTRLAAGRMSGLARVFFPPSGLLLFVLSFFPLTALIVALSGPDLVQRRISERPELEKISVDGSSSTSTLSSSALSISGVWRNPSPLLWQGVEYQGEGRFLIFAGFSWVALPAPPGSSLPPSAAFKAMKKNGQMFSPASIQAGWFPQPDHRGGYLLIQCAPDPGLVHRRRDYDGRQLCAEVNLPEFATTFERQADTKRHTL